MRVGLGHGAGRGREAGVHAHPAVVDALVQHVERLLALRDGAGQLGRHLHLAVHVARAVGHEALPVPALEGDGLGRGLAELVDQPGAGGVLLRVDVEERRHLLEPALDAPVGGLHHGAAPLGRVQEGALGHTQHPGEAHPLEVGVEGVLGHVRVRKRRRQPQRKLLAREVCDLRRLAVPAVAEEQHLEVRRRHILVDAHRGQGGRAARLDVDGQVPRTRRRSRPPRGCARRATRRRAGTARC